MASYACFYCDPYFFFQIRNFCLCLVCLLFIEYYSIASSYTCITIYVAKILPSVCMDGSNLMRASRPFPRKALQQVILPLHGRRCSNAIVELRIYVVASANVITICSFHCLIALVKIP